MLAVTASSAVAADIAVKGKAPLPAPTGWDLAFGSAVMNDYIFRGITQSNGRPSVAVYFEPRYSFSKDLQAYVGVAGESISFPNRAAAEIDIYGGIRPTLGPFAFDLGAWGYLYPGGRCFNPNAFPGSGIPGSEPQCVANGFLPVNNNATKRNASFYEVYGKVNITLGDQFVLGLNEYYAPDFFNIGGWGNYTSVTARWMAPSTTFGSSGVGMYISGEFGRQWLGTTDAFYGVVSPLANFAAGIPAPSYNTWNIGVGFTYKVFTLDIRYSDTNLSKASCNAFTSDFSTTNFSVVNISAINPGGFGSSWCSATGIVKLSTDMIAASNLK
jgi:uncharacterized protein (TIGR02001 family)